MELELSLWGWYDLSEYRKCCISSEAKASVWNSDQFNCWRSENRIELHWFTVRAELNRNSFNKFPFS